MKYPASRILLPKLIMYWVFSKSGVSMSGPHVGSMPIFLEDSQVEVWLTIVLDPRVAMNLSAAPPERFLPHFIMISLGCPLSRIALIFAATSLIASSQETRFHFPLPRGPVLRRGYRILSGS